MRVLKDTLIINSSAGAESLGVLKVGGVFPAAAYFSYLYTVGNARANSHACKFERLAAIRQLYYLVLVPFALFFTFFILFLYPNRQYLHADANWPSEVINGEGLVFERCIESFFCKMLVAITLTLLINLIISMGNLLIYLINYCTGSRYLSNLNLPYLPLVIISGLMCIALKYLYPLIDPSEARLLAIMSYIVKSGAGASLIKPVLGLFGNWTYALFYIASELLGNVTIPLLFWNFANQISARDYASRAYSMYAILGNVALLGVSWIFMSNTVFEDTTTLIVQQSVAALIIAGITYYIVFNMHRTELLNKIEIDMGRSESTSTKPNAKGMTLFESMKEIRANKHVLYIAAIVLAYNVAINLAEVSWKAMVKEATHGDKGEYAQYAGMQLGLIAICSMILGISSNQLRRNFSWYTNAIIPPAVLTTVAFLFYIPGTCYSLKTFIPYFANISNELLRIAVLAGLAQNVLAKAVKYVCFDFTKESAYMVLPFAERSRYKAAVDVLIGRGGKSLGALIQYTILGITGLIMGRAVKQLDIIPIIFLLLVLVLVMWFWAVRRLSISYEALLKVQIDAEKAHNSSKDAEKANNSPKDTNKAHNSPKHETSNS